MKNVCKKCGEETKADEKFCGNCGSNLSENKETKSMNEIIVSTGDIKRDYEILKPVFLSENYNFNSRLTFEQQMDKILEKLQNKGREAGGDAILFLRFDLKEMQLGSSFYFVYGTLVKFK